MTVAEHVHRLVALERPRQTMTAPDLDGRELVAQPRFEDRLVDPARVEVLEHSLHRGREGVVGLGVDPDIDSVGER